MPSTTNYAIPYPSSSDVVAQGYQNIQNVASSVDALLGTEAFMGGFRNKIINGGMGIWQRGAGPFSSPSGAYTADRWLLAYTTSTISVSRSALTPTELATAGAPQSLRYSLRAAVVAGAGVNDYAVVSQRIENVGTLAGRTVTVSFWATASAGSPKVGVSLDQIFGTGGTPSARVDGTGQAVTTSASGWTRYSMTFAVPSISGKTLGTNGDDYLQLNLWLDAGSSLNTRTGSIGHQSSTIGIFGVQLEDGSYKTRFEDRPPQVELALCQRYYEKTYRIDTAPGTNTQDGLYLGSVATGSGGNVETTHRFAVPKRSGSYTVTTYVSTGTAGSWTYWRNGASANTAATIVDLAQGGFRLWHSTGGAWVVSLTYGHWVADAEL
jgi:hypothetical protein